MPNYDDTREGLFQWQVERLRATTFYSVTDTPTRIKPIEEWQYIVGEQPHEVLIRPNEDLNQLSSNALGGRLGFTIKKGRIDWVLQAAHPASPEDLISKPAPSLGTMPDSIPRFTEIVQGWLDRCPLGVSRLAFATGLFFPVETQSEAQMRLAGFLPGIELAEQEIFDFTYQVNRRRESKVQAGVVINRLAKWSVAREVSFLVGTGEGELPRLSTGTESVIGKLDLDVNTAANADTAPPSETKSLFSELVDLSEEIARRGDLP